jgi:hypothetical protein
VITLLTGSIGVAAIGIAGANSACVTVAYIVLLVRFVTLVGIGAAL